MNIDDWIKIEVREYVQLHQAHTLHQTTDEKDVMVMSSNTGPVAMATRLTSTYPFYYRYISQ